jgi:hypothetical protein
MLAHSFTGGGHLLKLAAHFVKRINTLNEWHLNPILPIFGIFAGMENSKSYNLVV